jgi:sec-independent protein translocase protein TatC
VSTVSPPVLGLGTEKFSAREMPLSGHLKELRRRLVLCVIALVVASIVAVIAYQPILHFLIRPLCDVDSSAVHHGTLDTGSLALSSTGTCNLFVTSPLDGLSLRVHIAVFGGFVLASPVILFQLWRFVTPGLEAREKKYVVPFVVASFTLFVLGAATAYFTLPHALNFLKSVGGPELQAIYDPIPYLSLIVLMMTLFGLTFQFPVVLVSMELARVVTPARLLHSWRWAIILIVVVSGVFTPSSDPFSMLALALPLVLFFFMSIAIGKLFGR